MWGIWQKGIGLFVGTYYTRAVAIERHVAHSNIPWKVRRRRDGVRCVRVLVTFEVPDA
jgi:hypothetical protein